MSGHRRTARSRVGAVLLLGLYLAAAAVDAARDRLRRTRSEAVT